MIRESTSSRTDIYSKCSFYKPYASMAKLNLREASSMPLQQQAQITAASASQPLVDTKRIVHFEPAELSKSCVLHTDNEKTNGQQKPDQHSSRRPSFLDIKTSIAQRKKKIPEYLRRRSSFKQTNLDHILNVVGSFGLYQKLQFMLVGLLALLPSMVAYSYVFVSATPKFTCAVVREIQLTSYDPRHPSMEKLAQDEPDLFDTEDLDDPFKYFKLKRLEYFVETRRYIKLVSDQDMKNKSRINFDNNCRIETHKKLKALVSSSTTTSSANIYKKGDYKQTNLQCVEWVYDEEVYGRTTVTDWNLVCLKSHLKAVTQNAFILGTGCSIFTGIMSDKLGRKKALVIMVTLMFLVLNSTQILMHSGALSINQKFVLFTISRFFQGIAQTMYSISFVLLLEITGPAHRLTAGNILAYSFSIGQICIDLLAYYLRDWLKVQWFLAFYVMPFFLCYWVVPESPRWLLSMNKVRRARQVIEKITRVNNRYRMLTVRLRHLFCCAEIEDEETTESVEDKKAKCCQFPKHIDIEAKVDLKDDISSMYLLSLLQEEANKISSNRSQSYTATLRGIIRSPMLLRRSFVLSYTWMVILACYLGIGMGISGNLDRLLNPYLVFAIAAGFEFASIVTCHLVLNRFGRKYPLIIFMLTTSLAIYLIPVNFEKWPWVAMGFYFLAKYTIGAAQLTCMIFTSELYPTPMRSTGVGLSVAIARLGGVWAPQINVLSSTLGSIYVPFVIFAVMSLLAAVLCGLVLPETLNKELPSNLKEAKNLKRNSK